MWYKHKIHTLCHIVGGIPAPKNENGAFNSNGIPFVRMRDLGRYHLTTNLNATDNKISIEYALHNNFKPIPKGSILLPRSGSVGLNHRAILAEDSIIVSHICALIVKDESKINNRFLYYWLTKYDMNKIAKKTTGLDAITFSDLGNIVVSYPDIETQNKIVAVLDKANSILDKREITIRKFNELLSAVFWEMFGDPTNANKYPLRCLNMDNALKLLGGYAFKSSNFQNTGIPVIKIGTVNKGFFDIKSLSFLSELKSEIHQKYIVYPEDILITLTGTVGKDDYGNICKVERHYPNYLLNQRVAKLIINETIYNKDFIFYLFKHQKIKTLIQKKGKGVRQANISTNQVETLELIYPPIHLQNEFASKANTIQSIINKITTAKEGATSLLHSLSQQVFSERITIDVDAELDSLLNAIDIEKKDNENNIETLKNDLTFLQRLIDKLEDQDFENSKQYEKAKYAVFRIMREESNLIKQNFNFDERKITLQL
ncbi:restriction endonuclease subunit S [Flavobacterium ginsenosidimutans]|uniref:Restriction endonuclease subunit S n=1 Tax=Flavobacterium ginsenosidimutans TaxID=687844 RepID=A0ABZ2Q6R5_9FLAO